MTKTEILGRIKSFVTQAVDRTARLAASVWRILSLSLADSRIARENCLSVALEPGSIDIVYASRFLSRIDIKGTRHYTFEGEKVPTPESLASTVALAIKDLKLSRVPITLVVPKSWAIMRAAEFPATVRDNISAVVSYELDRLTPLNADRAFYDFIITGEENSRLKIMLAAVNSDILQPYLAALTEREIPVRHVTVSTSVTGTLGHYVLRQGSVIFTAIHAGGYESALVRDGRLQLVQARNLPVGDEISRERMVAETINALIDTAKSEGESPLVMVDHPLSETWCSRLGQVVQAPVRFIREIDLGLTYPNKVKPDKLSYTALGGVLERLWPRASMMNLLDKGVHQASGTPMAVSIGILAILVALGLFWILSPLQTEAQKIETMDREIAARKAEVKKIEALNKDMDNVKKEIAAIGAFKTSRPMTLIMLKEMTRSLPKNAWLSRVRIAESVIEIEGYAASATELLPKLEASDYFKKVDFASPTFRDTRMNADRFTIKMEIEGLPEEIAANGKQK